MQELPNGDIWLEEGDIIPMRCVACNRLYQPPVHTQASTCPHCGVRNAHIDGSVKVIQMEAKD